MADASPPLVFDTTFAAQTGEPVAVAPGIIRVTAPNAGPFTFTGTNSFLIGTKRLALLDPGPDDPRHHAALTAAIGDRKLEAIILTHTHLDHSAGVAHWRRTTGAPVWCAGPHRLSRPARLFEVNAIGRDCDWSLAPDRIFFDGEVFEAGDKQLTAVATPGHCANHMGYAVAGTELLFTGDHIMGWNSTLVAVPDGAMADYLASLRKVIALPYGHYLPAHGGPIREGRRYAEALLAHRELRNSQIRETVAMGARTMSDLLSRIYPTLSGRLRFAARLTLGAHLEYLATEGSVKLRRTPFGLRFSLA